MDSKALNEVHPQIGSAYVTEGKISLKYRSKCEFVGKSLLTNPLLSSDVFCPRKLAVDGYGCSTREFCLHPKGRVLLELCSALP